MHMADACRLICQQYLIQAALNGTGVRADEDVEYVHEMRVAVRRMRVALRLYGAYFQPDAILGFVDDLGRTGRLLGAVRDMDVALAKARHAHKATGQPGKSLLQAWQQQRDKACSQLLDWLDHDDYAAFTAGFAAFCAKPGRGVKVHEQALSLSPEPLQVRYVAPTVLMQGFAAIRSYEQLLPATGAVHFEPLHALRIDCKYLRYNLEFLRHLLGADGEQLIAPLITLQDVLGDLNDAVVSQQLLKHALSRHKSAPTAAYLEAQLELSRQLAAQAPPLLHAFIAPAMRQCLGRAIARL